MISVIVPVLDEARALPATLAALREQPGDPEIIVVDGGSGDESASIAGAMPGVRVVASPRGRARQMNAGAAVARGSLLLFLHADTRLAPGALARLEALQQREPDLAGAFSHRFAGADWRLGLLSRINNLRCRRSRLFFGDQAIFVSRTLFERVGGYPDVPLLEDVRLCERLRRHAKPRLLAERVATDARRFQHHGIWRSAARVLLILARDRLGLALRGHGFSDPVR